jgi:hypothetical protein
MKKIADIDVDTWGTKLAGVLLDDCLEKGAKVPVPSAPPGMSSHCDRHAVSLQLVTRLICHANMIF